MTWISARGAGSVPTEAARRSDRLKFAEVQLADRSQCLRGRAVLKAVRQAFEPGRILNLRLHESGDVVGPSAGSAAMIGRPVDADDRYSSCPCRTVPGLAFGVGHGCFTDRFAGHGFHSEALRHDMRGQRRRFNCGS